jgi:acetamidase/formamidase
MGAMKQVPAVSSNGGASGPARPASPSRAGLAALALRAALAVAAFGAPAALAAQEPTTHRLPLAPENVHWGYYDASVEPVLTIRSGDRVEVETMVAHGLWRLRRAGATDDRIPQSMITVEDAITERGPGAHVMAGPIRVEGAEPGDVVEVRILEIGYLTPYGVSGFLPAGGTLPDHFPYAALQFFEFDVDAGTATMGDSGVRIPLRPFFGSIGVAPPEMRGRISSGPPGYHGGNFDNKELVAGSTVYLPVHVAGAHVSIGDGHAAQGDGEVSGTAIETSLTGTIEIVLHEGRTLRWPRAETPTHYISMGLHTDLDEAARIAVLEMVDFVVERHGLSRDDAYILCSVALDLRVTQLVDGTKGIHGMLSKALFP